ncbi:prepilin-type N-terminal cleavage/methylation domain-containing protein [Thermosulfurimonas marina]|uniref:Prepilin-type N-terminal cleavage/methylation domain-containing protein n=1 Tax=Thermosulfurimonas marina TaxID=2047767 RepID=A0A6H1WQZ2_9BACT|nr:prepilin-type N-terminal cleavage/methylation domain-containing protein [Thermosulfurimonas marina]QJA05627.1 prepilin-type N-terminal cleavage/methylation domain-containing protein [Thermosulfurimonas marina]
MKDRGMTLVELMVTLVILLLMAGALFSVMSLYRTTYLKKVKIAETQIQLPLGVDLLRRDLQYAGFGLPWKFPENYEYTEATDAEASPYNDAPSDPPRPVVGDDGVGPNGSDYLVLKGSILGWSEASQKWGILSGGTSDNIAYPEPDIFTTEDYVLILEPVSQEFKAFPVAGNQLFCPGGGSFCPPSADETYLIYGLTASANFTRPFNRVDYYLDTDPNEVPARCAPGTGVLVRALLKADGTRNPVSVLECVADFQVFLWWDLDGDGTAETRTGLGEILDQAYDARFERDHLRLAEVFLVYHEGGPDPNFTYPRSTVDLGTYSFDLSGISNYQRYRWEALHFSVVFQNLR